MANYYTGTSGMVLLVPNKSHYPPEFKERRRLSYYASLLNSIEVNSSFYKIPQGNTIYKWEAEVPTAFRFTFKLWRDITHQKGLLFKLYNVHRFMQAINFASEKKSCLLVQLPPSAKAYLMPQLIDLIQCIRDTDMEDRGGVQACFLVY